MMSHVHVHVYSLRIHVHIQCTFCPISTLFRHTLYFKTSRVDVSHIPSSSYMCGPFLICISLLRLQEERGNVNCIFRSDTSMDNSYQSVLNEERL